MQEERKMKRAGITAVAVSGGILALNIAFFEGKERSDVTISDKRITFISPMAADGYWEIIADGIQEAAQEKDMDVKCIGFSELDQKLLIRLYPGSDPDADRWDYYGRNGGYRRDETGTGGGKGSRDSGRAGGQ